MTEKPPHMSKQAPSRGGSGEHPVVREMRDKFDSIAEHTVPAIDAVLDRINRLKRKSDRPFTVKDPRREEETDPRREGEEGLPIDVVELDESSPTSGTVRKKEK